MIQTMLLLIAFITFIGIFFMNGGENAAYRIFYYIVWLQFFCDIYESHVNFDVVIKRKPVFIESECLAYASAHFDTVNSLANTFFRYGYQKSQG